MNIIMNENDSIKILQLSSAGEWRHRSLHADKSVPLSSTTAHCITVMYRTVKCCKGIMDKNKDHIIIFIICKGCQWVLTASKVYCDDKAFHVTVHNSISSHQLLYFSFHTLFQPTTTIKLKLQITGPVCGESTSDMWISLTKGQYCGTISIIISLWHFCEGVAWAINIPIQKHQ